ncbi:MAG: hypothetical protein AAF125_04270 [Chloroflexota bacterium]
MRQLLKRLLLWATLTATLIVAVFVVPAQQQIDNIATFTSALRADIELAANDALGAGVRPPDWTANIDNTSEDYIADLWYDKELLANVIFGENTRPPDWLSVTVDRADILARNTRFDLEILADNIYGGTEIRPPTWSGAADIYTCAREIQNLNTFMNDFFRFVPDVADGDFGFCALLEDELRVAILETNALEVSGEALNQAILAARGDLERVANEVYGVNERPATWAGNTNIDSPLLLTDAYEDLRILADETLGVDVRPPGWIGLITESQVETWRNLRFDLELLATAIVPTFPSIEGERPRGWQGTDALRTCTPLVQDLVIVIESQYAADEVTPFTRNNLDASPTYCEEIREAANQFMELRPPTEDERRQLAAAGAFTYESDFAFSYLDTAALEYMGTMPRGTPFRAWYRNFNESTMMFVSGQDFALYIDRRFTTMPQDVFDRLPTLEGVAPLTFCDADWCDGPSPTPTPTGGALDSLLAFQTPVLPPTVDATNNLDTEDKTQVNFENVRITYLSDNLVEETSQVILELCQEPQRITCEPVLSVFDLTTNAPKPIINTQNGQNVYQFDFAFTDNLIIESATLRSPNIFVSPPSLPRN